MLLSWVTVNSLPTRSVKVCSTSARSSPERSRFPRPVPSLRRFTRASAALSTVAIRVIASTLLGGAATTSESGGVAGSAADGLSGAAFVAFVLAPDVGPDVGSDVGPDVVDAAPSCATDLDRSEWRLDKVAGFALVSGLVDTGATADMGGRPSDGSAVVAAGRGGIAVAVFVADVAGALTGTLPPRLTAGVFFACCPRPAVVRLLVVCGVFSATNWRSILTPPGVPGRVSRRPGDAVAFCVLLGSGVGMNRPSLCDGWSDLIVATPPEIGELVTCPSTLDIASKSSSTNHRDAGGAPFRGECARECELLV